MYSNSNKNSLVALRYIGMLTIIVGIILLMPLIVIVFYNAEIIYALSFLIPSVIAIAFGSLLFRYGSTNDVEHLEIGQDAVIVVTTWIFACLISSMPFIVSGQLSFIPALFESVSGWTTTGLSVMNVEVTPNIFLFFRSLMQFFGGVGLILVMLSALSETFGLKLYESEGHSDRLLPNLVKSSRMILSIYIGYVISGTILYAFFGMKIFDAVNHSMAALSTGGFSVLPNSIGQYDNIQIEIVTMILMIMGTTNFAAHLLLINGKFKQFFKVGEIRFLMVLIGIGVPILSFLGLSNLYDSTDHLVRVGAFQFISALSTTGFSTVTFTEWGAFSKWMLIALMIIGGGAGSTAGGIKLYRIYIIFKTSYWRLLNRFKSPNTVKVQYVYKPEGKHFISSETLNEASSYAFIYVVLLFLGTGVLLMNGYSFEDSLFEYASALGTVGLSVGVTSIDSPSMVLVTEIVGMLFGRLEVYVIFVSIIRIVLNVRNRALLKLMENETRRQS